MGLLDLIPDDPFPLVYTFRVLTLVGRYGSGKTALAVLYARRLIAQGYGAYVAANVPIDLPVLREYDSRPSELVHAVYIYDEAWQDLAADASVKAVKAHLAYLRKRGCYLLLASVLPLTRFLAGFPVLSFVFAMPVLWHVRFWQWQVGLGKLSQWGWCVESIRPAYGLYDSSYQPDGRWWLYDPSPWRGYSTDEWAQRRQVHLPQSF